MADRNLIQPADGETRTGTAAPGIQGGLFVADGNAAVLTLNNGQTVGPELANKGSWIALQAVDSAGAGTTFYFFVTTAGVLKVSSTLPTNTNSDGSAV